MSAPFIAPELIRQSAWGGGYERGVAYFRDGAVAQVAWDEASATLTGVVRGSGRKVYRCTIRLAIDHPGDLIVSASCSCPMQEDCKHTVATMLACNAESDASGSAAGGGHAAPLGSLEQPRPAALTPASPPPASPLPASPLAASPRAARQAATEPTWRSLLPRADTTGIPLALGIELRQRSPYRQRQWEPRRVEAVTPRALAARQDDLLLHARPLMRSRSTGAWIRGDASWDAVRRPGGSFDPAHARWFAEFYSIVHDVRSFAAYAESADWLAFDGVESHLLWPHLATADRVGVAIVPTQRSQRVELAPQASVELAVDSEGEGLRLSARVSVGDGDARACVRPIGHIGVYAVTLDRDPLTVTLAPVDLADEVRTLLAAPGGLPVPAADTEEFLRTAYPRLARRATITAGAGVHLPPAPRPSLVLALAFRRGDELDYRLEWDYPGLGRLPFAADPSHPLHPDRDQDAEETVREAIETAWAAASASPLVAAATLKGVDAAVFADQVLPAIERLEGVRTESTGRRPRYRELTGDPRIAVSTVDSPDPDWFDLGVLVTIDDRVIPFTPLFRALALRRTKLLLADGAYLSLAHPALDRLRELIDEAATLEEWEAGPRISRYQTALWSDFEDLADEAEPAVSWRATADALRDTAGVDSTPVPAALRAELRPYQRDGFDWLAFLWRHRLGGILADDMGLGKTLQLLALIAHTREAGEARPFLVVAPTSVLATWRDEAARFVPDLGVHVVEATRAKSGTAVRDAVGTADVIVTSYTLLRLDEPEFTAVEWAGVVLDEAQFVKNAATKQHRAVKALRADVVFAVTGTPMENSLTELWALLSLTAPGLFASARRFREEYVKPIEQGKVPENEEGGPYRAARLARLRRRIRPLVLRRTKETVAADLPAKQEQELHVALSPAHRARYDAVLQRERQKVLGLLDDLDRNRFIVFRSLTLLRMMSLAPALIDGRDARIGSSKLDALLDHVTELAAEGHRALVFSQFTSFLDLAARRLDAAGIAYAYLDGSTRRRGDVVGGFRAGEAPVFLISLKAGGFGLTLTEADYVFLLDPWWNPAAENQAIDRTHRIGQQRPVNVYRLIAAGTIEEKVLELQRRKARLFTSVMDDGDLFGQALTADDVRGLFEV